MISHCKDFLGMPRRQYDTYLLFGMMGIIGIILYGFWMVRTSKQTGEVSSAEARRRMGAGKYDIIVDVRTETEWSADHLPYSISIPIGNLVTELPEKIPDKNTRILFVCKRGVRASGVVTIARKLGYTHVEAMMGSYKDLAP